MKNAPNLELSLLARQWGASAVPFSEPAGEAWLETPHSQRALAALDQTATLRSVLLLAGPNGWTKPPPCVVCCCWPVPMGSVNPPWSLAG